MMSNKQEIAQKVQLKLIEGATPTDVAKELGITIEEVDVYGGAVRAITRAIDECVEEGILKDFLCENRMEVLKTLLAECNQE